MAPDLVIADAPYKVYPGGVIALWCKDWLGPARATLSTEADALSCTGTVVRDTQQCSTGIWSDPDTAFGEVDDTLVIPWASIPAENLNYHMFISMRVEGDWNPASGDEGTKDSWVHQFNSVCAMGFYGDAYTVEAFPQIDDQAPRGIVYYTTRHSFDVEDPTSGDTIHIRAFSHQDTTIEYLLDQIILLPLQGMAPGWAIGDFLEIPSALVYSDPIIDGADGGDANGKYTRILTPTHDRVSSGSVGDFQRKANGNDAEYILQLEIADGKDIENSTAPLVEPIVHAYSLHGARWRAEQAYTLDQFTRSTSFTPFPGTLGVTPEGFGWSVDTFGINAPSGPFTYGVRANGTEALLQYGGRNGGDITISLGRDVALNLGARFAVYDQFSVSGIFRFDADPNWRSGGIPPQQYVRISLENSSYELRFSLRDLNWQFNEQISGGVNLVGGPFDVSSWYADFDPVGFRIEILRYVIRMRVWDPSGAEPSTWDYEDFKFIKNNPGATRFNYDYGGDALLAAGTIAYRENYLTINYEITNAGPASGTIQPLILHLDDIQIDHDPYGATPTDMHVRLERPKGTTFADMTIPWGAYYFVYWGTGDFTDTATGVHYLVYASRVWVETTAPEVERAEHVLWWFRSVHAGIVPMNWRSADRSAHGQQRILVGG